MNTMNELAERPGTSTRDHCYIYYEHLKPHLIDGITALVLRLSKDSIPAALPRQIPKIIYLMKTIFNGDVQLIRAVYDLDDNWHKWPPNLVIYYYLNVSISHGSETAMMHNGSHASLGRDCVMIRDNIYITYP